MSYRACTSLAATFAICTAVMTASSAAQERPRISASVIATSISATSVLSNGSAAMGGKLYGGAGSLRWHNISLAIGYSEGTLGLGDSQFSGAAGAPNDGGVVGGILTGIFGPGGSPSFAGEFRMAEGYSMVGWHITRELELATGLHGRARIGDSEYERLLLVLLRARYEAPIMSENFRGYVEGWSSVAGKATAPLNSGSGRGGSAGVIAEWGPLGVRMSYGLDRASYKGNVRRETVEGLTMSIVYMVR